MNDQLLSQKDYIDLLKLALLNHNVKAAKEIFKIVPSISEMSKTQAKEFFTNMPKPILIGIKLLHYWAERVIKLNTLKSKQELERKISFFSHFTNWLQKSFVAEENKIKVADKLIQMLIEKDEGIILSASDLSIIEKSKRLRDIYGSFSELANGNANSIFP